MQRGILKSEATGHVDAYLEYRMIVGDRDNGQLLPEAEYEKLRKEFYEKREQHGTHFVNTGFLRNPNKPRRALDGIKALPGGDMKSNQRNLPGGKGSRVIDPSVSPLDLINRVPSFTKRVNPVLSKSRLTNSSSGRAALPDKTAVKGRSPPKRTGRGVTVTPDPELHIDDQIELLSEALSDTTLTEAKKYGMKKQLQMLQAKKMRDLRRAQTQYV
ncbi:hypothetical protein AKO1_010208 [Acrasis kona]|uniref:Uncharacterized protein n=1 Tax=Acrasis kona TaxID=1008807 RepID=A0AAW2ZSZ1_9EUKA